MVNSNDCVNSNETWYYLTEYQIGVGVQKQQIFDMQSDFPMVKPGLNVSKHDYLSNSQCFQELIELKCVVNLHCCAIIDQIRYY